MVSLSQAIILTFLAFASAIPLTIALSQKLAISVFGIRRASWNLLGYYGVTLFVYGKENCKPRLPERGTCEWLWTILPHLRLGDQSEALYSRGLQWHGMCLVCHVCI